ncbi:hypothetical protein VSR68_30475 [Paraburkholderia phymatum]|uniref:hypothetical protein n=1 Tax=Paraburkholderia phymatum TaxID=148447 RepID=UPI0031740FC8
MTLTKSIAIALALGGLTCGLLAAWFWERTTRVRVDPLEGDPYAVMPVDGDLSNQWWWTAQFRADQEIARLNTLAARWTATAVVLGTFSSVVGLF